MKGLGLIVVLVAGMAFVAGCGGGSSDPEPLSKQAFVAKGNAICKKANEERDAMIKAALDEHQGETATKADQEELVRKILPALEPVPEELGELGAPEGEEKKVESLIASYEKSLEETDEDPFAAIAGEAFADTDKVMGKYGLTACRI